MAVYHYTPVVARGFKKGPCEVCGKTAERSQSFQQTVNPFNKNPDGSVKTYMEIQKEVSAEALAWQKEGTVRHARCEG